MTKTHFAAAVPLILVLSLTLVQTSAEASGSMRKIDQALARSVVDRIAVDVERLRGLEFKRTVPVSVVSDDEAMEHHLERMEKFGAIEELRHAEIVMKVLGLAEPGDDVMALLTAALREQVGGFYDPSTDRFYLLDDMPAGMVDILTAHELTHALEDQYYSLDELLESEEADDDQLFARGSVTEGSATLLMSIYSVQAAFDQQLSQDDLMAMSEFGQEAMDAMPEVLVRQLMAPYVLGLSFVQGGNPMAWMASGFPVGDVNRVYEDPPRSSEQILHPEKYWVEDQRDDPQPVSLGDAGSLLGKGWAKSFDGVLGELNLALLVGASTPDPANPEAVHGSEWTNRAASGWGGDRYELWTRGDRSVVLLSTVWDTEADATQFSEALLGQPAGRVVSGRAVALVYGDPKAKRVAPLLAAMLRESSTP
jgi:hypothetical protein